MSVRLETTPDSVRIVDHNRELTPATKSTLTLRGFLRTDNGLAVKHNEQEELVLFALDLLRGTGVPIELGRRNGGACQT